MKDTVLACPAGLQLKLLLLLLALHGPTFPFAPSTSQLARQNQGKKKVTVKPESVLEAFPLPGLGGSGGGHLL